MIEATPVVFYNPLNAYQREYDPSRKIKLGEYERFEMTLQAPPEDIDAIYREATLNDTQMEPSVGTIIQTPAGAFITRRNDFIKLDTAQLDYSERFSIERDGHKYPLTREELKAAHDVYEKIQSAKQKPYIQTLDSYAPQETQPGTNLNREV